jgi:hypothetical protein
MIIVYKKALNSNNKLHNLNQVNYIQLYASLYYLKFMTTKSIIKRFILKK